MANSSGSFSTGKLVASVFSDDMGRPSVTESGTSPAMAGDELHGVADLIGGERRAFLHARDLLLADLSCPLTLETLSRQSGIGVARLKRGFPRHFGSTAHDLFQQARMSEARHRLSKGAGTVSEVASALGYSNFSHFAAAFRKVTGVNPSDVLKGK